MAATQNNTPDPMKAFRAIAMILNAREDGTKVRIVSVRKTPEDANKVGLGKSLPACLAAPEGFITNSEQCPETKVHISIVLRTV